MLLHCRCESLGLKEVANYWNAVVTMNDYQKQRCASCVGWVFSVEVHLGVGRKGTCTSGPATLHFTAEAQVLSFLVLCFCSEVCVAGNMNPRHAYSAPFCRFVEVIISAMFNTVSNKKIAVLGFAFKKVRGT